MNNLAEKSLQLWHYQQAYLRGINADTPQHEYEQALAVCADIHTHLKKYIEGEEYISFLILYADLFALKENLSKEIEIQEEIVAVRREQANANRGKETQKLSRSLMRAGFLHRDDVNARKAIEYMEEHLACEREIAQETNNANADDIAASLYFLANTYAIFGRNILAEDTYTETVEAYYNLLDKNADAETTLILAQVLIEYGDFYLSTGFFDNATDRYVQAIEQLRTISHDNEEAASLLQKQYIFMRDLYDRLDNMEKSNHYAKLLNDIQ